jgi:hypothetical protein
LSPTGTVEIEGEQRRSRDHHLLEHAARLPGRSADAIQPPGIGDPFELVLPDVFEHQAGSGGEISNGR